MAKRNAFLTKMQRRHEFEAKTSIILAEKWTRQAACDAMVLLFGYGKCMGKTLWGSKKIVAAIEEWTELFLWILRGAQSHPDSDAVREQVDRLLKAKVPPERYGDWTVRYSGWISETLKEEVEKSRPSWKRDGELTDDPVTSNLLKGVEQDAEKAKGKMV